MDPTVQVAFIGIITTVVTTAGVVAVAIVNNKKERGGSANEGVEAVLRERVAQNEGYIAMLERDNHRKELLIQDLREQLREAESK